MDYEKIKTVEDAASAIGVKLLTEEEHRLATGLPEGRMARNNYLHYLLTIVCRAINGEWEADWESYEYIGQIRYYVPARLRTAYYGAYAGLRCLIAYTGPSDAYAIYGVSLALKDYDRCRYVIEQFKDLWIEYLTGIK
jgi:hypothetical protein